jgi:hypothetical protein
MTRDISISIIAVKNKVCSEAKDKVFVSGAAWHTDFQHLV